MDSSMEIDGSWYAQEVQAVNKPAPAVDPSPLGKRSYQAYVEDLSDLPDASLVEVPVSVPLHLPRHLTPPRISPPLRRHIAPGRISPLPRYSPPRPSSIRGRMSSYGRPPTPTPPPQVQVQMPEPPQDTRRRIGGFVTSIYHSGASLFTWAWNKIFYTSNEIVAVETDSTGSKRRAVDAGSRSPSPSPAKVAAQLPGTFPAPTLKMEAQPSGAQSPNKQEQSSASPSSPSLDIEVHLPGTFPEPSIVLTPPDSRPGSSHDDHKPTSDDIKAVASAANAKAHKEEKRTSTSPATSASGEQKWVPAMYKLDRPPRPIRAPPPPPPKQQKPISLPEKALPQRRPPPELPLPEFCYEKYDRARANKEAEKDKLIASLVERSKRLKLRSPEVQRLHENEWQLYFLNKNIRAAEKERAEEKAAQEAAAEKERIRKEAEEARLKAIAEEEEAKRKAKEAKEAEEAAQRAVFKKEAREQLQAEADAAFAAELEKAREALIRPLEPQWDQKVRAVMEGTNERAVIVKTVDGVELKKSDFGSLLPRAGQQTANAWLNDEIVNAFFASIVADKKEQTGYKKGMVPAFEAYNTAWFTNYRNKKGDITAIKTWSRRKGIKGDNFLKAEKVFFPVNTGVHWMLLVISPQARTIEYLDSLPNNPKKFFNIAREFLQMELGDKYVAAEWTESRMQSNQQNNSDDCGAFTCLNGLATAKGYGFDDVCAKNMQDGRRMIGAVLLNGGFSGDWKL